MYDWSREKPKNTWIMIDDQPYSTVHCKFKKETFFILSKKSNNIPIQPIKCPHSNNSIPDAQSQSFYIFLFITFGGLTGLTRQFISMLCCRMKPVFQGEYRKLELCFRRLIKY